MSSKKLRSFLVEHPKLCEFAIAGAMAASTAGVELAGAKGHPGP